MQTYILFFEQKKVIELIIQKIGCQRSLIYENEWLNIEDIYHNAGWIVLYDKEH